MVYCPMLVKFLFFFHCRYNVRSIPRLAERSWCSSGPDDGCLGSNTCDSSGSRRSARRSRCSSDFKHLAALVQLGTLLCVLLAQNVRGTNSEQWLAASAAVRVGATTNTIDAAAVSKCGPDTSHSVSAKTVLRYASDGSIFYSRGGEGARNKSQRKG